MLAVDGQVGPVNLVRVKVPKIFKGLVQPYRYKSFWGGRGGAKSWAFARMLLSIASQRKLRILCTRQFQSSIKDSVYKLLCDQIYIMGLSHLYHIQKDTIKSVCGSEFIFKGLCFNMQETKSLEGIDICWVEEAQAVSEESWEILIPTIRKDGSEIWLSWNTGEVDDPTYKRFVINPPPETDALCIKVGYQDNPYFPSTLEKERLYLLQVDPDAYDHVWEGNPLSISEARIFKGKFVVQDFETLPKSRFYHGADWGFANDPACLIRCFIEERKLYIDQEAWGIGVELNEISDLFSAVPTYKEWPIRCDSSRPETISHVRKNYGIRAESCKKWDGSIKDGIAYLKQFEKIHIHPRCKHTIDEFKLYSYKTDPKTKEILPIIIDENNHLIDALRYSLDMKIKGGTDWASLFDNE